MSNGLTPGSSGAPPYTSVPRISAIPRRSSYASVVAGADATQHFNHPTWSSTRSNLTDANVTPSNSYPPQQQQQQRHHHHHHHQQQNSDSRLLQRSASAFDTEMQSNGASGGPPGNAWRRSTPLPAYSAQFASLPEYGGGGGGGGGGGREQGADVFFTPSYLKGSKYISQLAASHKAKASAASQKESSSSSNPPSLSSSSSHVNLPRMAPSHRGMTYDIIENTTTQKDENGVKPLPSAWNEGDKYAGLDIISDGLELRYQGQTLKNGQEAATARANHPIPPQCGLYYYEITVLGKPKDGMVGFGFSSKKASLERLPGWEQESWAYHGDDGKSFFGDNQGQGKPYGPTWTLNDTVGCGINFATGCAFFTKNGVYIGNAFREIKGYKLFPSVGVKKYPGTWVKVNFGQAPFVFDIDGMMMQEKLAVQTDIRSTKPPSIRPPQDENAFIQKLVAQFLSHDGYVETAQAFAQEVKNETMALENNQAPTVEVCDVEEDINAINRQKIRKAILDGDIDKALKLTNTYYANVLHDSPQIYFRLRCRKFIEMVRRSTEQQPSKKARSENGTAIHDDDDEDVFTHDMELDDEYMHDAAEDGEAMDMEDAEHSGKHGDLLHEAICYGQQLRADYPGDERKEYKGTFDDIFSLIAYTDPRKSVHGHLLDPSGRVPVAEELNSAILVSLGKSSSAAVERLFQQTEVLINEISEEGGAGALVNVRSDFLV